MAAEGLVTIKDRLATQPCSQRIPPIVYQTWVNNDLFETHAGQVEIFRSINPNLSFELFTNEMVEEYMSRVWKGTQILSIFERATYYPMKADIFRYCMLYERGGYYFDISKACRVPITALHQPNDSCLLSYERNDCLIYPDSRLEKVLQYPHKFFLQWGLGFTSKHPILKRVIELIERHAAAFVDRVFEIPKHGILMLSGPGMYTRAVRELFLEDSQIEHTQAGIDFNEQGVIALLGSDSRYRHSPAYGEVRNAPILV